MCAPEYSWFGPFRRAPVTLTLHRVPPTVEVDHMRGGGQVEARARLAVKNQAAAAREKRESPCKSHVVGHSCRRPISREDRTSELVAFRAVPWPGITPLF